MKSLFATQVELVPVSNLSLNTKNRKLSFEPSFTQTNCPYVELH